MKATRDFAGIILILLAVQALALEGHVLLLQQNFQAGQLEILNVATNQRTTLDDGSCFGPCFSPDGQKVAYNKSNKIYICNADGSGTPTAIDVYANSSKEASTSWARVGGHDYIYWSEQSRQIYRVRVGTTNKETVHTSSADLYMVKVSADGAKGACSKRAWSCWAIDIGGSERNMGSGCQGTVSPNGLYVTHNLGSHTSANIQLHANGDVVKTITTPTGTFNMHRFSHISNDWVVFTVDGNKAYLCEWDKNQSHYLGSGSPWDYFPGVIGPSDPAMALSTASLQFSSSVGETATVPASATVTVSNSSGGTLDAVTVSGTPAWLSVGVNSSNRNSQVLTNTVDMSRISSDDTYTATATVNCGNASPSSVTYSVTLVVSAAPVFTSVEVLPSSTTTTPGSTVTFTATALDQNGSALVTQPSFTWELSGDGTLDGSAYTAPAVGGGPYTVTATATVGDISTSGTAQVSVASFYLKVNCGDNAYDVDGWERDDAYVEDGDDYNFGAVATDGVANAAPDLVYKSCRHRTPHTYTFGTVPNGTYTLRLHLVINSTDRSFTYVAEGTTLEENWNPAPTSNLVNVAQVHDYTVTVSDRNGLTLACSSDAGDVFECGIEIFARSQPAIEVVYPNGGEQLSVGDEIAIRWNGDCGQVTGVELQISPDEGETWVPIDATGNVNCGDDVWENYTWTIPESLNGFSLVSSACLLRVKEYNGPEADLSDAVFQIDPGDATVMPGISTNAVSARPMVQRVNGSYSIVLPQGAAATLYDVRGKVVGRVRTGSSSISTAPGLHIVNLRDPRSSSVKPMMSAE